MKYQIIKRGEMASGPAMLVRICDLAVRVMLLLVKTPNGHKTDCITSPPIALVAYILATHITSKVRIMRNKKKTLYKHFHPRCFPMKASKIKKIKYNKNV